jgi:putative N-acetylmannosamine-6-phosphate epimerase
MKSPSELLSELNGRLIVSCQAEEGSAFRDPLAMARFARALCRAGRSESARMAQRISGRFGRRLARSSPDN